MTFRKIAIATDFSPPAEAAVAAGTLLAKATGAEVVLVHACELLMPASATVPDETRSFYGVALERLKEARAQLVKRRGELGAQGVRSTHVLIESFPDTGVCEAARDAGADLIVVGTHGRTGFRRFLLGSVAERVVRLADRPVLVVRGEPGPGAGAFRRVLVPTDFSPAAERALEMALELAADDGSVDLLHVVQPPALSFGPEELFATATLELGRWRELSLADGKQRLDALVESHRGARVRLAATVREGGPAAEIHRALEETAYDLVVMGTQGRRGLSRSVLGSVAEVTVRHAPCSVLVTHAPAQQPAPQPGTSTRPA